MLKMAENRREQSLKVDLPRREQDMRDGAAKGDDRLGESSHHRPARESARNGWHWKRPSTSGPEAPSDWPT